MKKSDNLIKVISNFLSYPLNFFFAMHISLAVSLSFILVFYHWFFTTSLMLVTELIKMLWHVITFFCMSNVFIIITLFKVINCCLVGHRLPPLEKLISLCRKINSWLKTDRKHVVVIHCQVQNLGILEQLILYYSRQIYL